jgi:hypothetical protein
MNGGAASVSGTFTFDAPTTAPDVGTYTAAATYTPTDTARYNSVAGTVSVTVNKATPSVSEWPTATDINYGQTLSNSTLSGGSGSVAGSFAFEAPTTAPNAGTCSASVIFTPTDTTHYNTVSGTVDVTVHQATPTVNTWPTASDISYGKKLSDSTLTGGDASVPGTFAFSAPTTAPNAGPYTADVTFTPTDTANYTTAAGTVSVTVEKAAPQITKEPTIGHLVYGQTLADASVTGGQASVPGSFAFDEPTTVPEPGTDYYLINFNPVDTANYYQMCYQTLVTTEKVTTNVSSWPTASELTYGQALADSVLNGGSASVAGTFGFVDGTVTPNAGTYPANVRFTPTDAAHNTSVDNVINVTVHQLTPVVKEWPTAGGITYGNTLADSVLTGGDASVAGTFAFTAPTTAPGAGLYMAAVTFTPNDTVNCLPVSSTVTVEVAKATPSITAWPTAGITYGQTLADATLNGGTAAVPGTFAFDAPTTKPDTGTQSFAATFTPDDTSNYEIVAGSIEVTTAQITPNVTEWPTASDLTYGDALGMSTLSGGAASVAGEFVLTDYKFRPPAGVYAATVRFVPDDIVNYARVEGPVNVTVHKQTPTVVTWPTAADITYGQALADATLTGGDASTEGSFAFAAPPTAPNAGTATFTVVFTPTDTDNYNTVNGSAEVIIHKAIPVVTQWPTASEIAYEQTYGDSTLSGATTAVPGVFTFDFPSARPMVGTLTAAITFTPDDTANYENVSGTADVHVVKATPVVNAWPVAGGIAYSQSLAAALLTGGSASTDGSFVYDTPSYTPNAGPYTAAVTFVPTDTSNFNTVAGTVTVQVRKATPTVDMWPTAPGLVYGQKLADAALSGGSASVPGTFAYDVPEIVPPAGTGPEAVVFTPTDSNNYESVSGTVEVTVEKATPVINVWPVAGNILYGDTLADSVLFNGEASVDGTFAFDAPTTAPAAGLLTAPVTFTPADTANYKTVAGTAEVHVYKASVTGVVWPTATGITYGQPLSTSTLSGGSASADGTFEFAFPAHTPYAGTYMADVNFTPADPDNYMPMSGQVPVVVAKATPTVNNWPTAAQIRYGQTLNNAFLIAGDATVNGTFAYDQPSVTPDAGTYTAAVTFTPMDTDNYLPVPGTIQVTVAKSDAVIVSWPSSVYLKYGQTYGDGTLIGGGALVPGTFTFNAPATKPNVGLHYADVTFTPTDVNNYNPVSSTIIVQVESATPADIVWPTGSPLVYGQQLFESTLTGGSAAVPGTFVFDAPGMQPDAGTYTADIVFVPSDMPNYLTVQGTVSISVSQATPSIVTWPTAATIVFGQTLADTTLYGGQASALGSFVFDAPATAPNVGTAAFPVTFVPTNTNNYKTVAGSVSVTVNQATPTVDAWPTAAPITYGRTVADAALSGGSASTTGTFVYDSPAAILPVGTHTVAVTFTPTNTTGYGTVAGTVEVTVVKATPVVTAWPAAGAITVGQALSGSVLSGGNASVAGAFAFANPSVTPAKGTYAAAATFTPSDTANYNVVNGTLLVVVNDPAKVTPTVTWPSASAITYGQPCSSSALTGGTARNTAAGTTVPGTFAFAAPNATPAAGTYTAEVIFTPANLDKYNPVTGTASVTVRKATPIVSTWPVAQTIVLGQAVSDALLSGGTANVPGNFVYETPSTVPGTAGSQAQNVLFIPSDAANWLTVSGSVPVVVNEPGKITPAVVWPTATPLVGGQTLALSTLVGGSAVNTATAAPVAGSFAFTAPDTVLNAGVYNAAVVFLPADTAHYNSVSGSVTVTVNRVPNPPELQPIEDKRVEEGQTISFLVTATDVDHDTLTLSAQNLPAGAQFTAASGLFVWTPAAGTAGVYPVTFGASDGIDTVHAVVNITVTAQPIDDTPVADVRPPVILAGPLALELSDHNAIIAWTTDEPATGEVTVWVDDQAVVFEEATGITLRRDHIVALSDLAAGTAYTCTVSSTDAQNNGPTESPRFTFSTTQAPELPTLAFRGRPTVVYTSDTLAGVSWETDNYSVVTIEYGKAAVPPSFTDSVSTNTYTRGGSLVLGSLTPGTMYQARVTATDTTGTVSVTSPVFSFTTATAPDTTPPVITEGPIVKFVTHDHALVYWVTNKPTVSTLHYGSGSTKSLSGSLNESEYALEHTAVLTNLLPATGYTLNCTAEDPAGNEAQAEPKAFQTPTTETVPAPAFTAPATISEVGTTSALLSWTTDQQTDAYAMLNDGQNTVAVGELTLAQSHAFRLTGLVPGTAYTVTVRARNTSAGETEGDPVPFTTAAPDTTPPAFAVAPVITVASGGTSATLAWSSTEPARVQVSCGLAADNLGVIAGSDTLATSGELTLAPLTRGTTYFYTVTLTDEAGNPFTSQAASFDVPAPTRPNGGGIGMLLAGAGAAMLGLMGGGHGGGGGGPCFIATAAYGTPMAVQIDVLREFRDSWLLTNVPGTALVDFYYRISPSIAGQVAAHPALAALVRLLLIPVLVVAKVLVTAPEAFFATLGLAGVAVVLRKRKKSL